jgi:D-3-phosphoglycerate dehydrogenase
MTSDSNRTLQALCTEPENYSELGLNAITDVANLDLGRSDREGLLAGIGNYDLLFVRLKTFIDSAVLEKATRLKAIVSPTTGLNHIDMDSAAEMGVEIFHLKGQVDFLQTVTSTAEHTWGLLLALTRNIPSAFEDVLKGHWRQDPHRGHELQGKRLGILGFGRLGQMVANYGHAFGMQVLAFDTGTWDPPDYVSRCSTIDELLGQSDVFSIHIPLNERTAGSIGRGELARLPKGAVLLNTSRGEIIDERALIEAMDSGHLLGAAVDVVDSESKFPQSVLLDYARNHRNLVVTPHIAGATFEAVEKTDLFVINRLKEWIRSSSTG